MTTERAGSARNESSTPNQFYTKQIVGKPKPREVGMANGSGNGGAVTVIGSREQRFKCPKFGVTVLAEHLRKFDLDGECWEKYGCKKCGVFKENSASGNLGEVLAFQPKPSSRNRGDQEVMKRKPGGRYPRMTPGCQP